jgi:hypothetical protein
MAQRLFSDGIFDAAAACATRIRELGLTPGTHPYMRGQSGYGDYVGDIEDLCRVWNGGFDGPNAPMNSFEWAANDDEGLSFWMSSAEAEDSSWVGPAGYRFTDEDQWRMEQIFRFPHFALQHAVVEGDYLVLPEFENEWIIALGFTPMKEDGTRIWCAGDGGPYENLRIAFLDETDPLWRTQPRRF